MAQKPLEAKWTTVWRKIYCEMTIECTCLQISREHFSLVVLLIKISLSGYLYLNGFAGMKGRFLSCTVVGLQIVKQSYVLP